MERNIAVVEESKSASTGDSLAFLLGGSCLFVPLLVLLSHAQTLWICDYTNL